MLSMFYVDGWLYRDFTDLFPKKLTGAAFSPKQ